MVTLSCTLPETHTDTAQQIETDEKKKKLINTDSSHSEDKDAVGYGETLFILFAQAVFCLFPALLPVVL